MTTEYVFNELKAGRIKLTDEYVVSENAWRKGGAPAGGSTMFAILHSRIAVDDLLHGAIIQSGNDACMVLAEGIAGNERAFADKMTKRARELGFTQSTFANSNGLPEPGNKMTVRELAKLARYIIQTYPEFYKLFGEREFTWNKIRQPNRNPLRTSLEGADGLKTGYTKDGGYGMVGSAVQNGIRLIVVVNGLEDPDDRASEAKKMLEWGFRNFEARTLSRLGDDSKLTFDGADALFDDQGTAPILIQFCVGKAAAEFESAAVIFDAEQPGAALSRQAHQHMLCPAMAAHIGQGFAQDSGNLAASRRREVHLGHIADELRSNAGVLAITGNHAGQKIGQVPGIELKRLELLDQVANVGGFVLHQLLHLEQFLLAFCGGDGRAGAQRI